MGIAGEVVSKFYFAPCAPDCRSKSQFCFLFYRIPKSTSWEYMYRCSPSVAQYTTDSLTFISLSRLHILTAEQRICGNPYGSHRELFSLTVVPKEFRVRSCILVVSVSWV